MSQAGQTIKMGLKLFNTITAEKHHSSVTDWIEILTGDNYAENELDAVSELVQAVDIQPEGPDEVSRAIRKKIKYGSTHRQLRALTLLKSLSENSRTFPKSFVSSPMLVDRLKEAARDSHTDPRVKKKLMLVFLGWQQQSLDGDRAFDRVKGLFDELGGGGRKASHAHTSSLSATSSATKPVARDGGLWDHSWDPSPSAASASRSDSKAHEQQARLEALERKEAQHASQAENDRKDRERREYEKRERDLKLREEKLKMRESSATKLAGRMSNAPTKKGTSNEPKRPPFNFEKEKPAILQSVAGASQSANNLINAIRLVNREKENITENERVQKYLEEAKQARRKVIRYIQVVEDEEYIGTLLSTNENIIVSLQLYDKMSKPSSADSDDDAPATAQTVPNRSGMTEEEAIAESLAASHLQKEREGELARLQSRQRLAVDRHRQASFRREASQQNGEGSGNGVFGDLAGLDFAGGSGSSNLAPPIQSSSQQQYAGSHGSLSDLSDYDSSDDDYQIRTKSRRQSPQASSAAVHDQGGAYGSLNDNLLMVETPRESADPFADPFFGEAEEEPEVRKPRKEYAIV